MKIKGNGHTFFYFQKRKVEPISKSNKTNNKKKENDNNRTNHKKI